MSCAWVCDCPGRWGNWQRKVLGPLFRGVVNGKLNFFDQATTKRGKSVGLTEESVRCVYVFSMINF